MRLEQKRKEMELADLTLVASRYVEATIREFYPHKEIALAPYGVDAEFWTPGQPVNRRDRCGLYMLGTSRCGKAFRY